MRGVLRGQGDAGNRITVKCLCESAFLLADLGAGSTEVKPFAGGGEWQPPVDQMWLLKCGANGDHNPHLVSADQWNTFQNVWRDIASHKIDVGSLVT